MPGSPTHAARAQARILAELRKDRTWLDPSQLALLPPAAARITDDELIAALAVAQRPGGWNVGLRMTALAKYGTPRALPRVKAIYESQQDTCQPELGRNGEGEGLEIELRNAIARGRHWLATDADLRLLESLCISERCRYETQQDLRAWQKPLRLELRGPANAAIAQYYQFESLADIEEKLGQFPKGTQFELTAAPGASEAAAEIRKFGAGRGLGIVPRAGH